MAELGVNIDHVATVRQARRTYEPDPVWAAAEAQLGGADGITMHLREDRRHIQDDDVSRVKAMCHVKVNLEMAATAEMVAIAQTIRPHLCMLVPEGRQEVTTEGGLDVAGNQAEIREVVSKLKAGGMKVSAFIDAEPAQIKAAAHVEFDFCEIHTGPYAEAFYETGGDLGSEAVEAELQKVAAGGEQIIAGGMGFNAGHALNYVNVKPIAQLDGIRELHIGHAIVSRAIFVGLRQAVREMKGLISG